MIKNIFSKISSINNSMFSESALINYLGENIDKHVFITCAPKSGSTWLSSILKSYLKWDTLRLVPQYGYREQELHLSPILEKQIKGNLFSPQQHLKYSEYTETIFKSMDTKVILLVRNIYDTVMSFKDHCENESVVFPSAYMNIDIWKKLLEEEKLEFIAKMVIPWYISFYCGWINSDYYKSGNVHILTYQEMISEKNESLKKVFDFIDEPFDYTRALKIMDQVAVKKTRKNKGVAGRGDSLDIKLKNIISDYTKFYPGIDFSPIGLLE